MAFAWHWLRGNFDDPVDAKTFASFRIVLNGQIATKVYDHVAGGEQFYKHCLVSAWLVFC